MGISFCSAQPAGCQQRTSCSWGCSRNRFEDEKTVLPLTSKELMDSVEDDGDLAGALELALKAIAMHKADRLAEAEKFLDDSGRRLENSQMLKNRILLKESIEADSDVQTLRQYVAKMQEVKSTFERASPEVKRKSSNRMSSRMTRSMSPEAAKEMASIAEACETDPDCEFPLEVAAADLASPVPALKGTAGNIEQFCKEMRIYEAHKALVEFEVDVASAQKMCEEVGRHDLSNEVAAFAVKFLSGAMPDKIKKIIARLEDARKKMQPPSTDDKRWAEIQIKEPLIGDSFCFTLYLRHMEDSERDPTGPSTQLFAVCKVSNMVGGLDSAIALQREVDLFSKSWLKQVLDFRGERGGSDKLFSSHAQTILTIPVVGKVEDNVLREFAFTTSQYPNEFTGFSGYGVALLEYCFPSQKDFEGWTRWDCPKGATPSEGSMNYFFYYPARDDSTKRHNSVVCSKLGAGIPKWVLPLTVIKRVAGVAFKEQFRNMKQNVYDHWQTLPYKARIAEEHDFYAPIHQVMKEASENPSFYT